MSGGDCAMCEGTKVVSCGGHDSGCDACYVAPVATPCAAVEGVDYAEAARIMFEACRDRFMRADQCYAAIDALAAAGFLTAPPARTYADGVGEDPLHGVIRKWRHQFAPMTTGEQHDALFAAIRLLSQGEKA